MAQSRRIAGIAEIRHKAARNGGGLQVQALIELLAGFIALLAAAALSQFGVDLNTAKPEREVHRVSDCPEAPASSLIASPPKNDC